MSSAIRCEDCEYQAALMAYKADLGASEWEAFIHLVPTCDGCRQVAVIHGTLPAPNVEQLLDPDPERFLAGGRLHEACAGGEACDGLCTCDGDE